MKPTTRLFLCLHSKSSRFPIGTLLMGQIINLWVSKHLPPSVSWAWTLLSHGFLSLNFHRYSCSSQISTWTEITNYCIPLDIFMTSFEDIFKAIFFHSFLHSEIGIQEKARFCLAHSDTDRCIRGNFRFQPATFWLRDDLFHLRSWPGGHIGTPASNCGIYHGGNAESMRPCRGRCCNNLKKMTFWKKNNFLSELWQLALSRRLQWACHASITSING